MPQPPAYNRTKDFTEDFGSETDHASLNAELDNASNSINDIRTNLAVIQADDGKVRQSAITTDSLSVTVRDFLIEEVSGGIIGYRDQAIAAAGEAAQSETNAGNSKDAAALSAANAAASAGSVNAALNHLADTGNPHHVTKAQVGLGNVDNTSDINKPVSTAMQAALDNKVTKTSDTGAASLPSGTTAQRPAGATAASIRLNTETKEFEGHNGLQWGTLGGGPNVGGAGNKLFFAASQVMTQDCTIPAGFNAVYPGPLTIADGKVLTLEDGVVLTIV